MTRVKICGVKRVEHAVAAVDAGADFVGLMFYAGSRRYIDIDGARGIAAAVRGRVKTVGVFVDAPVDEMNQVAAQCDLDYIQLSGNEPDEIIQGLDCPAIQVIHVRGVVASERLLSCPAEIVLLDTAVDGVQGGSGQSFDWTVIPQSKRPVMLAGGLHAGNVADAIARVRPWGVDVSSGVETGGEKDPVRIREFLGMVKR